MEHLLDILREQELRFSKSEVFLTAKNDPRFERDIAELHKADGELVSAINTYPVAHLLRESSIQEAVGEGLIEYNRGLFSFGSNFFLDALLTVCSKYEDIDLVGHYDGVVFDPIKREDWEAIMPLNTGESIAIYARDLKDYRNAKNAIDILGGFIGNEVEIPFKENPETGDATYVGNPDSDVEKLVSMPYQLSLSFPDSLRLTESLTAEINDASILVGVNMVNKGSVQLLAHFYNDGTKSVNAKSLTSICLLNDKTVSELVFTLRGGHPKEAAYSILHTLGLVKGYEEPVSSKSNSVENS